MHKEIAIAQSVIRNAGPAQDTLSLKYDDRFLRRKKLRTVAGQDIIIDLAETTSLDHGDAVVMDDGALIGIEAATEDLLEVRGDLPKLAWHIGNRHTPCQIEPDRILIQRDRIIADMLGTLGAEVREIAEPFTPERGAYGHGRTHGHRHD